MPCRPGGSIYNEFLVAYETHVQKSPGGLQLRYRGGYAVLGAHVFWKPSLKHAAGAENPERHCKKGNQRWLMTIRAGVVQLVPHVPCCLNAQKLYCTGVKVKGGICLTETCR